MGGHLSHVRGDCEALIAELFGYLDGELSPARCRKIERHLDQCPCCGYLAVRLRRAVAVCRAAGQPKLPAAVRRDARARITELLGRQWQPATTTRRKAKGIRAASPRRNR